MPLSSPLSLCISSRRGGLRSRAAAGLSEYGADTSTRITQNQGNDGRHSLQALCIRRDAALHALRGLTLPKPVWCQWYYCPWVTEAKALNASLFTNTQERIKIQPMSGDSRSRRNNLNGAIPPQERSIILGVGLEAEGAWAWVVTLQWAESAPLLSTRDWNKTPQSQREPLVPTMDYGNRHQSPVHTPRRRASLHRPDGAKHTYAQYSRWCAETLVFYYILLFNRTTSLPRTQRGSAVNQICTDFYFMQNYFQQYKTENIKCNRRKRAT